MTMRVLFDLQSYLLSGNSVKKINIYKLKRFNKNNFIEVFIK